MIFCLYFPIKLLEFLKYFKYSKPWCDKTEKENSQNVQMPLNGNAGAENREIKPENLGRLLEFDLQIPLSFIHPHFRIVPNLF